MSNWLDVKYINLLSSHLRNFKRKSQNLFNFSCPYCGDSQRDKRKARGYVYEINTGYLFTCHNCGHTTSAKKLIKHVNPVLYDEYLKEQLTEQKPDKIEQFQKQKRERVVFNISPLDRLKTISELDEHHPGYRFLAGRKIPREFFDKLYWCDKFMHWTNETCGPDAEGNLKFSDKALLFDEPRIIIPFLTKEGKFYGYQGRSLRGEHVRIQGINNGRDIKYISIIINDDAPKLFGMDRVDQTRTYYVFEGPFDSMFIPNSVAATGSDLLQVAGHLNKDKAVMVFDNEPLSPIMCRKIQRAINLDYKVFIWPKDIAYKDVNDWVMSGVDKLYIKHVIDDCTHSGLMAQLEFNKWKKCNVEVG